ncbi:alkaline phosphatase [Siccirubricoccus sp. KC 17139]|uniref:Alkaline phosphatase n=2 Tax=Siccirubricoccus soli TaxID=2899147 RepID=A0ABT1CYB3_9PROT|nr:alkaline phosphatase [Siccirubricoccus soli]MCP2680776.1 alkaline phosphatase [Siccirubricoccus soli]
MLPDGASAAYASNYRFFKEGGEAPVWEALQKGLVQTDSFNNPITDSAAGATAYATGVKTRNGTVGEDFFGHELTSIADLASAAGKATGLVSTSAITDASPASFGASIADRDDWGAVARQYILDNALDVILGAGRPAFLGEGEGGSQPEGGIDLLATAQAQGMNYVASAEALEGFSGDRVLGLFSDEEYLDPIGPRPAGEPSLLQMTDVALDTLAKDQDGFFLFVEEENTDTYGHANDAATAMHAMAAFEASVARVLEFQKANPDTLVVILADHDTGGMTSQPGTAPGSTPAIFRDFDATAEEIAADYDAADPASIRSAVEAHTGLTLTDAEIAAVQAEEDSLGLAQVLSARGGVHFTTTGHTAADVPIYAIGPGAEQFLGIQENAEVGAKVANAFGLELPVSQQDGGALRFQVIELYDAAFDAIPHQEALDYWVQVAAEGGNVAAAFASRLEERDGLGDQDYVVGLLRNALDAEPEAEEVAYWTGFLAGSGSRTEVLEAIAHSPEHQAALLQLPVPEDGGLFG